MNKILSLSARVWKDNLFFFSFLFLEDLHDSIVIVFMFVSFTKKYTNIYKMIHHAESTHILNEI